MLIRQGSEEGRWDVENEVRIDMQCQSQMTLAHASTINARTHTGCLSLSLPSLRYGNYFPSSSFSSSLLLFLVALARDGSERHTRASPTRAPGRN